MPPWRATPTAVRTSSVHRLYWPARQKPQRPHQPPLRLTQTRSPTAKSVTSRPSSIISRGEFVPERDADAEDLMQRVGVADSLPWWRADTPVTVSYPLCIRPTRLTHRTGVLPSGQETLPCEKWNLASLRLRNHHLTMNHRTEPHAADKTSLKRITK